MTLYPEDDHLKVVIHKIGMKKHWHPCNCRRAFERDCRRSGCAPAQMEATRIIAGYVKLEDIR